MSLDKVLHDKSLELEMTRKWAGRRFQGCEEREAGAGQVVRGTYKRKTHGGGRAGAE
jgi:hypothetical protein